jgi:hypothetical protein
VRGVLGRVRRRWRRAAAPRRTVRFQCHPNSVY